MHMSCIFSNDLFTLMKCGILHVENLKSDQFLGWHKAFIERCADKLIVASIYKNLKKIGSAM